jgi:peroxiredoxin
MLAIGDRAPLFVATGTDGRVELRSLVDKGPVVLYFFPRSMTGG